MKQFTFRLKSEQDLKKEIEKAVHEKNIEAGVLWLAKEKYDRASLGLRDTVKDT